MKALITGGSGFIGGHLTDKLVTLGFDVIVIDNESADAHKKFHKNKKAEYHKLDINDYEKIEPLFAGVDFVFHLAAESRIGPCIENPMMACKTNVIGTCNVLQASRNNNIKRLVYSSTSACYGLTNVIPMHEDLK